MSTRSRVLFALLLPVGLMAGWSPASEAPEDVEARIHTELRESRPAADSVVDGPVRDVLLVYTGRVQLPLSRVNVTGPDGTPVATGALVHPEGQEDRIRVPFPEPLPPGRYTVEWRVGAPDGHIVSGSFAFTVAGEAPAPDPDRDPAVEEAAPPPPPRAEPAEAVPLLPPGTGTRWLHLLGTILVLGVVGFRIGVLEPLGNRSEMVPTLDEAPRHLRRLAWLGALLLLVTVPIRLLLQMEALETGLFSEPVRFLLFRTGWGAGWFVHLAAALMVLVGLVVLRGAEERGRGWGIVTGAAFLLPLVPALSGHAWSADVRVIAVPVLYVHVAAVGVWLGGLVTLLAAGLPAVRGAVDRAVPTEGSVLPPLARLVNGFSRVAVVAVAVLVLAGGITAFIQVGSLTGFYASEYGRTLLVKLALVAVALLLGFYNWRKVRPGLATQPDPGSLRIPASIEASIGILVLLVTAVLVSTPLP